jgi:hypothetical protein
LRAPTHEFSKISIRDPARSFWLERPHTVDCVSLLLIRSKRCVDLRVTCSISNCIGKLRRVTLAYLDAAEKVTCCPVCFASN